MGESLMMDGSMANGDVVRVRGGESGCPQNERGAGKELSLIHI